MFSCSLGKWSFLLLSTKLVLQFSIWGHQIEKQSNQSTEFHKSRLGSIWWYLWLDALASSAWGCQAVEMDCNAVLVPASDWFDQGGEIGNSKSHFSRAGTLSSWVWRLSRLLVFFCSCWVPPSSRGGRLTSLDASFARCRQHCRLSICSYFDWVWQIWDEQACLARCFAFWRTSSKTSTSMFFFFKNSAKTSHR